MFFGTVLPVLHGPNKSLEYPANLSSNLLDGAKQTVHLFCAEHLPSTYLFWCPFLNPVSKKKEFNNLYVTSSM